MAETSTGLRWFLTFPRIYNGFQILMGAHRLRRIIVNDYIQAKSGDHILDIGCGTAEILELLPEGVSYDGFDLDESYIGQARARYGNRGRFTCQRVSEQSVGGLPPCDLVLALGILHHLDAEEARQLFSIAARALRPTGRLMTIDPCYAPGQSSFSRFMVSRDRGRNVLDEAGYRALAQPHFPEIVGKVHHDLIYVPFTHYVMLCRKHRSPGTPGKETAEV